MCSTTRARSRTPRHSSRGGRRWTTRASESVTESIKVLRGVVEGLKNGPRDLRRQLRVLEIHSERIKTTAQMLDVCLDIQAQVRQIDVNVRTAGIEATTLLELQSLLIAPAEESLRRLETEVVLLEDEGYSQAYDSSELPQDHQEAMRSWCHKNPGDLVAAEYMMRHPEQER